MRLKKLELFGFKSFADRTEIIFDEGVTCVVGPNGCGKSNISDSIRWVLGERSAKMLRGSKMEDVIFNGTDFRKPIAMAEVSLTIDNTDRGLPIEYNEVTITRRLYRSGESEYLINKTICRLKDIQDLILDTGIGSNSYSMIEQGRIDYILNADADARRFLIEEAAGISKFKVKKEEAIRKLERTEENRLRLNDIIHEVHKNIQYAERQARRAERYKEEFERLKKLEVKKAFADIAGIQTAKTNLQNEKDAIREELTQVEGKISGIRKSQEALSESLREITERYRQAESERYGILNKFEQNQQQLKFNQEKRLEIANRQGQIQQEVQQLDEHTQKANEEILQKQQEMDSIAGKRASALEELSAAETAMNGLEAKLTETRRQLEGFKTQSFEVASAASRVRNEYHRLQAFLETTQQQKQKQDAGANRLQEEASAWLSKKQSADLEIITLTRKVEELTLRKAQLDSKVREYQETLKSVQMEEEQTARTLHERETRLSMLQEIEQASRANEDALLEPSENFERQFVFTLRDIFTVSSGFEWALEAALESFSKSLIAQDLKTAEVLLDRIRDKKATATGVFVRQAEDHPIMNWAPEKLRHAKIVHALSDVVTIKEGYEPLFRPFIQNTYISADLNPAELLENFFPLSGSSRFLTQGGLVLGPDQKIFFRNTHLSAEQNTFKRNAEIETLAAEVASLQQVLTEKTQSIASLETSLHQESAELETQESHLMEAKLQKESLESVRESMEERLESFKRELELIGFELKELSAQQDEASVKKNHLELELAKAEEQEQILRDHQESIAETLSSLDQQKTQALHTFAEHKAAFSHIEERRQLLEESLKIMRDHQNRNQQRIQDLKHETDLLSQRQAAIAGEDTQLEANQEKLQEARREADIAVELVRQEKEKAETTFNELQEELMSTAQRLQELQGSIHQFEMKFMDLGYQEKNISERLLQTYRLNLSELNAQDYPAEEGDVESDMLQEIEALRKKVESLGTVNLLAIEEYEELKQRYEFLMTQQKDLDDAKEQLMETIRKINRTTKGLFEETFTNVQKQFQEYYQTLFRGGHAQLVLVDESNPLESGIDIVVRPPGKKPQHISLLSGGEKALTAIALLFALFKIKPSPFCVLDEVDAPLDEANVDRFLSVLDHFLQSSQFIIVTHNRKTIAKGNSLYGVTMQEAGISKLVSVKVSKDKNATLPVDLVSGKAAEEAQPQEA